MRDLLISHDFRIGVLTGAGAVVALYLLVRLLGPRLLAAASFLAPRSGVRRPDAAPRLTLGALTRAPKGGRHTFHVLDAVHVAFRADASRKDSASQATDAAAAPAEPPRRESA
jgi:hypothetical protein